ncbi:MAG: hypothetical protein BJ554DRAFT_7915, partial [Olpidium bornovanus]
RRPRDRGRQQNPSRLTSALAFRSVAAALLLPNDMAEFSSDSYDSAAYNDFRPVYPDDLYSLVARFRGGKEVFLAADVGSGTGQVARALRDGKGGIGEPHLGRGYCWSLACHEVCASWRNFELSLSRSVAVRKVLAFDASEKMLQVARETEIRRPDRHLTPDVEYRVCKAEKLCLPSESVDLVTVAQAAHWFDMGLLLQLAHDSNHLAPYWVSKTMQEEPGQTLAHELYVDDSFIPPPDLFGRSERYVQPGDGHSSTSHEAPLVSSSMPLSQFTRYVKTWSAYHKWKREHPDAQSDIVDECTNKMRACFEAAHDEAEKFAGSIFLSPERTFDPVVKIVRLAGFTLFDRCPPTAPTCVNCDTSQEPAGEKRGGVPRRRATRPRDPILLFQTRTPGPAAPPLPPLPATRPRAKPSAPETFYRRSFTAPIDLSSFAFCVPGAPREGRRYELRVIQQPLRARMCGFGDKVGSPFTSFPRITADVPWVHVLLPALARGRGKMGGARWARRCLGWLSIDTTPAFPQGRKSNSEVSFYVLKCDLYSADGTADRNLVVHPSVTVAARVAARQLEAAAAVADLEKSGADPSAVAAAAAEASLPHAVLKHRMPTARAATGAVIRNLIGCLMASATKLTRLPAARATAAAETGDAGPIMGIYFVLQDLSVRTEGNFRFKFSFIDLRRCVSLSCVCWPEIPPV